MNGFTPVAYAYLDHNGDVCYTGNMEGPYPELKASQYGNGKGELCHLFTENQVLAILGDIKSLLDKPDRLREFLENILE